MMERLGLAARIRERLRPRWQRRRRQRQTNARERAVLEEIAAEFTTEELREFLEADLHPVKADPQFKEELRRELWDLVQSQSADEKKRTGSED
jgi:hypothetical protein